MRSILRVDRVDAGVPESLELLFLNPLRLYPGDALLELRRGPEAFNVQSRALCEMCNAFAKSAVQGNLYKSKYVAADSAAVTKKHLLFGIYGERCRALIVERAESDKLKPGAPK